MPVETPSAIAPLLLDWYDTHARVLPWRSPPGDARPDPYRVWLSEIMLQQTTTAAVTPYFRTFTSRWPDFSALAAAEDADVMSAWAGLGYYARARNLLACARAVRDSGGALPDTEAELRALPGIGSYTAAAIASIAFGRRAVVVDGNVERVIARLFRVDTPLPAARRAIHALTDTITPATRAGDFAQAMMDLGASICAASAPACLHCPLRVHCAAAAEGAPASYPRRAPKAAKPQRFGTIFWVERDGAVALVRRPANGLLGGMRALPTGAWAGEAPGLANPPCPAVWRLLDATVAHVFTHFRLELALAVAVVDRQCLDNVEWWPVASLGDAGLPTVFAKAARAIGENG